MTWRTHGLWTPLGRFARSWSRAEAGLHAAALAYYALFSLPPAMTIVVVAAGHVLGPTASRGALAPRLTGLLPRQAAELLQTQIATLDPTGAGLAALVLGVAGLAWGGSRGLAALRKALDALWDVPATADRRSRITARRFLIARGTALGLLVIFGFVVAAVLSLEAFLRPIVIMLSPNFVLIYQPLLDGTFTFAALALLLATTYTMLPSRRIPLRAAVPGALVAAFVITIGRRALGYALALTGITTAYGAAASLIVLVLWFNLAAQVVLAGACVGVVLEASVDDDGITEA